MAFTEFCCRSGGSNLNAGTRTGSSTVPGTAADLTYASGTWVSATGVFTPAAGDPVADGVAVGDFASVYADGASVTTLVGRVTARTTTTITVSTTVKSGTTTDGTSNRTLKIGGAWAGPNGTDGFPFNAYLWLCQNVAGDPPRINVQSGTYSITAAITQANASGMYQGFGSAYGDGGTRPVIDGGTSGASYVLLAISGQGNSFENIEFANNGATGSAALVTVASFLISEVISCVFRNSRGAGLSCGSGGSILVDECEAYLCNASNTANGAGIVTGNAQILNTISHDNAGSNSSGFYVTSGATIINCIADTNGAHGFNTAANTIGPVITNCDAYGNTGSGIVLSVTGNRSYIRIKNTNVINNGAWGLLATLAASQTQSFRLMISNMGYHNNTSGTKSIGAGWLLTDAGEVSLGAVPYNAPTTGDFRITLAAAKGAGRGVFTQTQASYTGTVGYPDIGAAQHADSGGGGIPIARGMHGGMR